ncbi:MAG: pseudouridine synthase [Anaerotruncus sp.]|nr:pseudouridine synthase [Anaerotruncus sp.]
MTIHEDRRHRSSWSWAVLPWPRRRLALAQSSAAGPRSLRATPSTPSAADLAKAKEAKAKYEAALAAGEDAYGASWRLARVHYWIGDHTSDKDAKKPIFLRGHRTRQEGHRARSQQGRRPFLARRQLRRLRRGQGRPQEPGPGQAHQGGHAPRPRDRSRLRPGRRRPRPRPRLPRGPRLRGRQREEVPRAPAQVGRIRPARRPQPPLPGRHLHLARPRRGRPQDPGDHPDHGALCPTSSPRPRRNGSRPARGSKGSRSRRNDRLDAGRGHVPGVHVPVPDPLRERRLPGRGQARGRRLGRRGGQGRPARAPDSTPFPAGSSPSTVSTAARAASSSSPRTPRPTATSTASSTAATCAKTYLALRRRRPRPSRRGRINAPIREFGSGRMGVDPRRGKPSSTEWKLAERLDGATLLRVHPATGRRHQIRVHLYHIGHPILGDPRYGDRARQERFPRLMLHALAIEFALPSGERVTVEAPAPPSFEAGPGRDADGAKGKQP